MIGASAIGVAAIGANASTTFDGGEDPGGGDPGEPGPNRIDVFCQRPTLQMTIRLVESQVMIFDLKGQPAALSLLGGMSADWAAEPGSLELLIRRQDPAAFDLAAQPAALVLNFGARFDLASQAPELQMSGVWPGVMRADLVAELATLDMHVIPGQMMRMDLAAQRPTLQMRTGGRFDLTAQPAQLELAMQTGGLMRFDLAAQRATLSMGIRENVVLRFDLTCQPMQPAQSLQMVLAAALPRLELEISAAQVLEYEAYAVNLTKERAGQPYEVTRYTGMPFTRILRYRGAYYGLSATGLYKLGGPTDAGVKIPTAWRTHLADFGSTKKKTTEALYVSGRLSETTVATVIEGERGEYQYPVVNMRGAAAQVYRVKLGRGIKSNFLGFGLADVEGGVMHVATLTDRTAELSRPI